MWPLKKISSSVLEVFKCDDLIRRWYHFPPFDFNEKSYTPLHDIDPDIQFYSDRYSSHSYDYYLEGTFNDRILQNNDKDSNFAMLHTKIRSALKNLASLERYINHLYHNFTVIGISESWFKEHNVDRYGIEGYNGAHTFRPIRSGGKVSIFVQNSIECFVRTDLCYLNTHVETNFIEFNKEQIGKDKNVIIGVIYRPLDTDIKVFNEHISELLDKIKSENKCCLSW